MDTGLDSCPKCGTKVIRSEQKCGTCGEERNVNHPWSSFKTEDKRGKISYWKSVKGLQKQKEIDAALEPIYDLLLFAVTPVVIIFLIVASLFFWWLFFAIAPAAILCWAVMTGKIKLTHEVDVDEFLDQE